MHGAAPDDQIARATLSGSPIASMERSDQAQIAERLRGRCVMVTGAAGSIGAELCRQIAALGARALVAFDQAETPLFLLQGELSKAYPKLAFHAVVGDITRCRDVSYAIEIHRPSTVYHAAAYKHVALMEGQIFAGVENNVFGTVEVAKAASQHGVESFVLISTDKAVRPPSVMGATKRIAELVMLSSQGKSSTKFVAVRFGNVVESSGSVIPIFKAQIATGGPLTVTDAAMMRYFMTVAEASELVLQASVLGQGGEIFVFDMGAPIRILDLAKDLIRDAGFEPEREIRIEFTGARPGEKLVEELSLATEHLAHTTHAKIRSLTASSVLDDADFESAMGRLREAVDARDGLRLIAILKEMVPEYDDAAQLALQAH